MAHTLFEAFAEESLTLSLNYRRQSWLQLNSQRRGIDMQRTDGAIEGEGRISAEKRLATVRWCSN